MKIVVFCLIGLMASTLAQAATYYIDASGGADTNNGTSKVTAWAHAPGMLTCTNTCASTTPVAGDSIIFKGGETWGNSNFKWTWSWAGTSGSRIYLGVDQTWYTGGSWTRPIFTGSVAQVGTDNLFLKINGSYVTVDNIEWTGALSDSYAFGGNAYINPGASTFVIIENNYFHGWANAVATDDLWRCIVANTAYPGLNTGMIVRYNVFSGKDTAEVQADLTCTGACTASGQAEYYGPNFIGNVCEYMSNCYVGSISEAAYNLIYEIRESTSAASHENAFESIKDQPGGAKFHDNVIHTTRAGVNLWLIPATGDTSYAWNNVMANTTAGNVFNIGDSSPPADCCGAVEIYNNTIECGPDSSPTQACVSTASGTGEVDAVIKNNHWITSAASPISGTGRSLSASNNVAQTKAAASAEGMTFAQSPYKFIPPDGSTSLAGAAIDLTSDCAVMTTLCSDTLYGVVYDETAHTATLYGRTTVARPNGGSWDSGAYQATADYPTHRFSPSFNLRRVSWEEQ